MDQEEIKVLGQVTFPDGETPHHCYSAQPLTSTYIRDSDKGDHVLLPCRVLQSLFRAGLDPYGPLIPSDHRGYFLDIDLEKLLGCTLAEMGALPIQWQGPQKHDSIPKRSLQICGGSQAGQTGAELGKILE